jgi:hypothetical protein
MLLQMHQSSGLWPQVALISVQPLLAGFLEHGNFLDKRGGNENLLPDQLPVNDGGKQGNTYLVLLEHPADAERNGWLVSF